MNDSHNATTNDKQPKVKGRYHRKRIIVAICVIVTIVAIVVLIIVAYKTRKVTINGKTYTGVSMEEAEEAYENEIKDKAKYAAEQKEACEDKGSDYIYVASSDECLTYDEYQMRDKLEAEQEYKDNQDKYKNDPEAEIIDAYNNYNTISATCKYQIADNEGYTHMYEHASMEGPSTITKDNIVSINGDSVTLKINVEYIPGTLVQSKPQLHQERATFKDKTCTIDMQKEHRDLLDDYFNS